MTTPEVSTVLPPLYAGWIDALLASTVPSETRATCDDCAMCAPEGALEDGTMYFSPRTKCCTYLPRLPNYLVGRALEDRDFAFSVGRATLEKRVASGVEVTPLGVGQSRAFETLYYAGSHGFGRAESMRCPHYLEEAGGRCGIWRHRNSVCATWFCKFERGAVGENFWNRVRNLLLAVERALSVWCVLESDLEPACLAELFEPDRRPNKKEPLNAFDLDGIADAKKARVLWGSWLGREEEFYRSCARRVDTLAWRDVERIGGSGVSVMARLVQAAFQELRSEVIPERLEVGPLRIMSAGRDGVRVIGYTGSDVLELDAEVMQVLPYFDGRPTLEAVASIETDLGIRVEEDLIRRLADFEILVRPGTRST